MTELPHTLDQRRATYALATVQKHRNAAAAARYATLARGIATMVLQNGLGQALAYLLADAEGKPSPALELYNELQAWLCGPVDAEHPERVYSRADLIAELMAGSRADYQRAQRHALNLLAWMRKFVDAYLPKGER